MDQNREYERRVLDLLTNIMSGLSAASSPISHPQQTAGNVGEGSVSTSVFTAHLRSKLMGMNESVNQKGFHDLDLSGITDKELAERIRRNVAALDNFRTSIETSISSIDAAKTEYDSYVRGLRKNRDAMRQQTVETLERLDIERKLGIITKREAKARAEEAIETEKTTEERRKQKEQEKRNRLREVINREEGKIDAAASGFDQAQQAIENDIENANVSGRNSRGSFGDRAINTARHMRNMAYEGGYDRTPLGRFMQGSANYTEGIGQWSNMFKQIGQFFGGKGGGFLSKIGGSATKLGATSQTTSTALNGMRGAAGKAAGGLSKVAGVAGMVLMALQMVVDFVGSAMNYKASAIQYQDQQEQINATYNKALLTAEKGRELAEVEVQGKTKLASVQKASQDLQESVNLKYTELANSVDVTLGFVTKGILNTAFDAASKAYKFGAGMEKFERATEYRAGVAGRTISMAELQKEKKIGEIAITERAAEIEGRTKSATARANYDAAVMQGDLVGIGLSATEGDNANHYRPEYTGNNETGETIWGRPAQGGGTNNTAYGSHNEGFQTEGRKRDYIAAKVVDQLTSNLSLIGLNSNLVKDQANLMIAGARYSENYAARQVDAAQTAYNLQTEIVQTAADYEKQVADESASAVKSAADTVTDANERMAQAFLEFSKDVMGFINGFDVEFRKMFINLGYTSEQELNRMVPEMMARHTDGGRGGLYKAYGTNGKELAQIQTGYSAATGRNRPMSGDSFASALSLGRLIGDTGEATNILAEFDTTFNQSFNSVTSMLGKTFDRLNKMGINTTKYAKEIVKNLSMANKFQFKGGTQGMLKMAELAAKMKFELSSLEAAISNTRGGGLEGVITQSAKLQVLGGNAAMVADPLGMLYDAYADPASYMERIMQSVKGFGSIDRKTGETTYSINEEMFMEAIADAYKIPVETLKKTSREQNKREVVKHQLTGEQLTNLSKEQQDYLMGAAKFDREQQKWVVDTLDDVKDLSSFNSAESLKDIIPEEHNERMETYVQRIISLMEQMTGQEEAQKLTMSAENYVEAMKTIRELMIKAESEFQDKKDEFNKAVQQGFTDTISAFSGYINIYNNNKEDINKGVESIRRHVQTFASEVGGLTSVINQARSQLDGGFGGLTTAVNNITESLQEAENRMREANGMPRRQTTTEISAEERERIHRETVRTINSLGGYGSRGMILAHDAVAHPSNTPHIITGSNVTSINDGSIQSARTHPDDFIYAMKYGGPLDRNMKTIALNVDRLSNIVYPMASALNRVHNSATESGEPKNSSVNVNFNGSIRVEGDNGHVVEIFMKELETNPAIRREMFNRLANNGTSDGGKGRGALVRGQDNVWYM